MSENPKKLLFETKLTDFDSVDIEGIGRIREDEYGNVFNHDPRSIRVLLMHKKEILKLAIKTREAGFTLIPLKFYLKKGLVKVLIGLCTGKHEYDKRQSLKKKQDTRDTNRAIKEFKSS